MFFLWFLYIAVIVLMIVGMWKVFVKAGKPGWAAIIPFYNMYVLLEIVGKPGWWLIMFFIPVVNIVFLILTYLELAPRFGKSAGFAVGLIFLPFVFFPILGLDSSQYIPPGAPAAPPAAPTPPAAKPQ
jgi:hypothetical protein